MTAGKNARPAPAFKAPAILALAAFLLAALPTAASAASSIEDIFLMMPDSECGGYGKEPRQLMLQGSAPAPGLPARSLKPDPQSPWVDRLADNLLVLHRPGYGDITYKSFESSLFQLIAVCRERQRTAPVDSTCLMNLCLFRLDQNGLYRVELRDYLPRISILDFVTADTMADPRAVKDIRARAPYYAQCLTCKASTHDRLSLDIVTSTTVNASACADFLPPFGLLPLTWNGRVFTKPYDRADPKP